MDIGAEGAQEVASLFVNGFGVRKFVVKLFEELGEFIIGHGAPLFLSGEIEDRCYCTTCAALRQEVAREGVKSKMVVEFASRRSSSL